MVIDKQQIDRICRELYVMATCKPVDVGDQVTLKEAYETIFNLWQENQELEEDAWKYRDLQN